MTDDPFPKSAESRSYAAPLAIIVAISVIAILVVAIVVGLWMYKSRQFHKRYSSLPEDPLVVSDDSGSEAELYTVT